MMSLLLSIVIKFLINIIKVMEIIDLIYIRYLLIFQSYRLTYYYEDINIYFIRCIFHRSFIDLNRLLFDQETICV